MSAYAPIALFVYNRPIHTLKTLEALQANHLASESDLFIFADAPASDGAVESTELTRQVISRHWKFRSVQIIQRQQNLGLANNIIDGVTRLTNEYGTVIVFEDDLISAPYTLAYFNHALNKYKDEEKVVHINAYCPAIKQPECLPETFFVRSISSWGWATWQRAWNYFEPDINQLIQQFDTEKIHHFNMEGSMNFWKQMIAFKNNKNNSWAIRWYASVFLRQGLALNPARSLISNIGHDGSGVHSQRETTYDVVPTSLPVISFPEKIIENNDGYTALKLFFKNRKGSLYERIVRFARNKLLYHIIPNKRGN